MKVIVYCSPCSGTGLYHGFAERKGEFVPCVNCKGTGAHEIDYEIFAGRKSREGVESVKLNDGRVITYQQFNQLTASASR